METKTKPEHTAIGPVLTVFERLLTSRLEANRAIMQVAIDYSQGNFLRTEPLKPIAGKGEQWEEFYRTTDAHPAT